MWNPYTVVYKNRVIIVTIAYRLNIMGFFTTMDGESQGNFGIMDQLAALSWVKTNIESFGGNPNNICLMGYGAGAISIGLHMINQRSHNYFHKAIIMSGNVIAPHEIKSPNYYKDLLDDLAEFFGCFRTPTSALMSCLRRADANALVSYTSKINWRPIFDQGLTNLTAPLIPEPPKNFFERGDFHKIPILTGYTNMEEILTLSKSLSDELSEEYLQSFLSEIIKNNLPPIRNDTYCVYNYDLVTDSVMFFYKPAVPLNDTSKIRKIIIDLQTDKNYGAWTFLQSRYVSNNQPTYVYRFDTRPSTNASMVDIPEWVSVPHLFDLIFVWGIPYWGQLNHSQWDNRDKRTSDIIMLFWTNFAKYSNPTESTPFPIEWYEFSTKNPGVLIIDRAFNMSDTSRINYKAYEFWIDYYPKIVAVGTQCCNATDFAKNLYCFKSSFIFFSSIIYTVLNNFLYLI